VLLRNDTETEQWTESEIQITVDDQLVEYIRMSPPRVTPNSPKPPVPHKH